MEGFCNDIDCGLQQELKLASYGVTLMLPSKLTSHTDLSTGHMACSFQCQGTTQHAFVPNAHWTRPRAADKCVLLHPTTMTKRPLSKHLETRTIREGVRTDSILLSELQCQLGLE